jgi:hypothetical protein
MRIPAFVRHPLPWVFAASIPTAVIVVLLARDIESTTRTHETQALNYLVQLAALLLPLFVAAVWWRGIGRWARSAALLACVAWSLFALRVAMETVEEARRFVANMGVVDELVREPLRAMETPPEVAAARALAVGDTSFLAAGGYCGGFGGVDTATARRYGVRVITGTFHNSEALTAEHRAFDGVARGYLRDYNLAVLDRLGVERLGHHPCPDIMQFRRAGGRFFWP